MTLPDRAWIQSGSKHHLFRILPIPKLLSAAKEGCTVIQIDAAINSRLEPQLGILMHLQSYHMFLVRAFSPIFLASIPNLTAFFSILIFPLALLFTLDR